MSLLPIAGEVARVPRQALLEALDDEHSSTAASAKCKCSLSFAALIQKPPPSAATPSATREDSPPSALAPRASSLGAAAGSELPPQFRRTALSSALPLHRCEAHRLIRSLPQQYHNSQWVPLFDTKVDGYSLPHFYRTLQMIRQSRPSIKGAVGFFEVLTRAQWESATEAASQDASHVPAAEQAPPQMSIYNSSNTSTGPSLLLNTASPTVSASAVAANFVRTPPCTSAPTSPLSPSARAAVLERVSSWSLQAPPSGNFPRCEREGANAASNAPNSAKVAPLSAGVVGADVDEGTFTQRNLSTPSVIGVFAPIMPTLDHGPHHFFGSRDTSVFAFTDAQKEWEDIKAERRRLLGRPATSRPPKVLPRHFRYHAWSGANEEFLICSPNFLGVGGGEDGASIYIDADIQFGTSAERCPTFGHSSAANARPVEAVAAKVETHKGLGMGGASCESSPPTPLAGAGDCVGSLFGTRVAGLSQTEFFIVRMQWFGLDEGKYIDLCSRVGVAGSSSPVFFPTADSTGGSAVNPPEGLGADNVATVPKEVREAIAVAIGARPEGGSVSVVAAADASTLKGAALCGCGGEGASAVHKCDGY